MNISQVLTKLKAIIYSKSETDSLLGGKANSSHTHTKSQITDFPSLATVATSGSYTDLSNKPTIPSNTNQLTNGAGYLSGTVGIANGGTGATTRLNAVKNLTNENVGTRTQYFFTLTENWGKVGYASVADAKSVLGVPTNTNQLTNGAGFITSSGSCNYANSAGSSSIATRNSGGTWISGRDNAVVKQTRHSTADGGSWNPAVSIKTKNGNWTIGTVGYDRLQFSYDTDADYNAGSNKNIVVELNPENGRIITSANTGNISISGYQVYVG